MYGWVIQPVSVCYLSVLYYQIVERESSLGPPLFPQTAQTSSPSQALAVGHMETLTRSSSTDFLLLLLLLHSEHPPLSPCSILKRMEVIISRYEAWARGDREKLGGQGKILQIAFSQSLRCRGLGGRMLSRWIKGRMSHFVRLSSRGWQVE